MNDWMDPKDLLEKIAGEIKALGTYPETVIIRDIWDFTEAEYWYLQAPRVTLKILGFTVKLWFGEENLIQVYDNCSGKLIVSLYDEGLREIVEKVASSLPQVVVRDRPLRSRFP